MDSIFQPGDTFCQPEAKDEELKYIYLMVD